MGLTITSHYALWKTFPYLCQPFTFHHIPEHKLSHNKFYSVTGWCNNHALTVSPDKAIHIIRFQVKQTGTYKYETCNSHGKEYCCFKDINLKNTRKIYVHSEIRHCLLMPNNNVPLAQQCTWS